VQHFLLVPPLTASAGYLQQRSGTLRDSLSLVLGLGHRGLLVLGLGVIRMTFPRADFICRHIYWRRLLLMCLGWLLQTAVSVCLFRSKAATHNEASIHATRQHPSTLSFSGSGTDQDDNLVLPRKRTASNEVDNVFKQHQDIAACSATSKDDSACRGMHASVVVAPSFG
jgi:hypothetical protein